MKIISFGWTTPALLAGEKTCTRRDWSASHAMSFRPGELVAAWNALPRVGKSPRQVATVRIESVTWSDEYPDEDWQREGFGYLQAHGLKIGQTEPLALWRLWRQWRPHQWVVRFELVEAREAPKAGRAPAPILQAPLLP